MAISIVIILVVLIKFSYVEKFLDWYSNRVCDNEISKDNLSDASKQDDFDKQPQYIYETFLDKDGNEVVVEMKKKIINVDGRNELLYEETAKPDIFYYNRYEGIIESINDNIVIFLVDRENKTTDLNNFYHDLKNVDDYEIEFNLDDYDLEGSEEFGTCDLIAINDNFSPGEADFETIIGKNLQVHEIEGSDNVTKIIYKSINFIFTN